MRQLLNVGSSGGLILFLCLGLACNDIRDTVNSEPDPAPQINTVSTHKGTMLPAYPLPGERYGAGKADQYDNYKWSYPSTYGITNAPKTPMRASSEWADSQALLLTWTGYSSKLFADIIAASAPTNISIYIVHDGNGSKQQFNAAISQYGISTAGLKFVDLPNDSVWMRDYGPLSVRSPDGTVSFVDPKYYHARVYDDAIPTHIASSWGMNVYRQPLSWEGGTYITDGYGNCYYSQGVYWYGGVSQNKVHQYQKEYLGCQTQTVMKPLQNEGTTHSDMFAKLSSKSSMVLGEYKSSQDFTNKGILDDNADILNAATLNDGSSLTVTRIPMPSNSGQDVWRTYANTLFVNGVNLVPVYTDSSTYQQAAMSIWQQVMPTWQHVAIDSTGIIPSGGAVHCITMKVPNGPLNQTEPAATSICNGDFSCEPSDTGGNTCGLGFEGCCDGNTLHICKNGSETTESCGSAGCGWNDTIKAYACGGSGAGPANAPLACGSVCVPNCDGAQCGSDGCGGECGLCADLEQCMDGTCIYNDPCDGISFQGCCENNKLKYCASSKIVVQNCSSACGWNANGNSGEGWYQCGYSGEDPTGSNPKSCAGSCQPNCDGKQCGNDGCGGDCGSCEDSQQCVGNQCVCQPDCANKQCGPDGCGGTCGACNTGFNCENNLCIEQVQGCGDVTFAGVCKANVLKWCDNDEVLEFDCLTLGLVCKAKEGSNPPNYNCFPPDPTCTPNCADKTCGPDGCGGVCGNCNEEETCTDGQCVDATPSDPCDGVSFEGCCDDDQLNWCENNKIFTKNCDSGECGWDSNNQWYDCNTDGDEGPAEHPKVCGGEPPITCTPDCVGKTCGDDGCGESCGQCADGSDCQDGQCVSVCVPDCTGKLCGDNGCGGQCGLCLQGQECIEGVCTSTNCQPKCDGKQCGDDGCNGSCGTCPDGESCDKFGQCAAVNPCIPVCTNKECGDDGCGGQCGVCGKSETCTNGLCTANVVDPCNGVPSSGICQGNLLKWCTTAGSLGEINCEAQGLVCAMAADGSYDCISDQACVPACGGKSCGPDACGDVCGVCPKDFHCTGDGQYVTSTCQPQCDGQQCGADGCGGVCGECGDEFTCSTDNQCESTQCVGPNCPPNPTGGTQSDDGCGCVVTGPQSRGLKPGGVLLALGCLMLFVRLRKVRYNGL